MSSLSLDFRLLSTVRAYPVPPAHPFTSPLSCTCRLIAIREGRPPPTELPAAAAPPARTSSMPSHGGSGSAHGPPAGSSGESHYDREMRLRREAEERMRAKFGEGGLKGQSVSNSGGLGYTPPEPQGTECVITSSCCHHWRGFRASRGCPTP